jgi:hypothetical protein
MLQILFWRYGLKPYVMENDTVTYKILQLKLGIREALFLGDDRNFFNTDVHVSSLINFKRGWGIEMDYDYLTQLYFSKTGKASLSGVDNRSV